ncbi:allophanate hydrolase [Acidisoma cellulosilytica]|uniref:Allophanate hydrolase n=1 Tax=Acidisoma cellulosilyticum TaxID=2802395 RepID=A0A963Z1T6_9PROT|nr:allophanate hydrolase [Acidisoma cellulosilyticum]MCB8881149.1 allophanate hydrolase [Acidisoma cellulosilyticum]
MSLWDKKTGSLDFATLRQAYTQGLTPTEVVQAIFARIDARGEDPAWILQLPRAAVLARAAELEQAGSQDLPLWGLPLSVKDNFDIAGYPTAEACRAFSRMATKTDPVVQHLVDAGAIIIGKTNMDQFGVGINGTRTDYGIPRNTFDPAFISGGSTSGGGATLAAGLVSMALGGDAAGSGRVPAALNNTVGIKPTPGLIPLGGGSRAGMSASHNVMTMTVADGVIATRVMIGYDAEDPLSRPEAEDFHLKLSALPRAFRFGVPSKATRIFAGDAEAERLFDESIARLERMGGKAVELDFAPFYAAAKMLYEDAFIARRYANLQSFFDAHEDQIYPATREIIGWGRSYSGADVFVAQQTLARHRQVIRHMTKGLDIIVTPTTPTTFTVEEMLADNIRRNAMLGTYTNFVNLLDMCAVTVPMGFRADGQPLGISFVGRALEDSLASSFAHAFHAALGGKLGATETPIPSPLEGAFA